MTKHTQGEWHVFAHPTDLGSPMRVCDADGVPVAYCNELDRDKDECIANAKFIALAPMMLIALRGLVANGADGTTMNLVYAIIDEIDGKES